MTTIKKINYKNKIIKISIDNFTESFDIWDHLPYQSKLCLKHKRYNFKNNTDIDFDNYSSWEQIENALEIKYKGYEITPVFMFEHGGVVFSSSLTCKWDSGQIGYILIPTHSDDTWFDLNEFFNLWTAYFNGDVCQWEVLDICNCCGCESNMEDHEINGGYIDTDQCETDAKLYIDFLENKKS